MDKSLSHHSKILHNMTKIWKAFDINQSHPFCVHRNITVLHKMCGGIPLTKTIKKVTAAQNTFLKILLRVEIVLRRMIKKYLLVLQSGVFTSTLHNSFLIFDIIFKIKLSKGKRYIKPKLFHTLFLKSNKVIYKRRSWICYKTYLVTLWFNGKPKC